MRQRLRNKYIRNYAALIVLFMHLRRCARGYFDLSDNYINRLYLCDVTSYIKLRFRSVYVILNARKRGSEEEKYASQIPELYLLDRVLVADIEI